MKANYLLKLILIFTVLTSLTSCEVIGGIFKTGMGVGAIVVIAVIGLIIFFIAKGSKK